ncbi:hypothetical protein, partial [Escherichia coli]|uniref:hypothetical protein n=1 Tax=Escherichia coli TaxID=562 RepID=UPI001BAEB1DA
NKGVDDACTGCLPSKRVYIYQKTTEAHGIPWRQEDSVNDKPTNFVAETKLTAGFPQSEKRISLVRSDSTTELPVS